MYLCVAPARRFARRIERHLDGFGTCQCAPPFINDDCSIRDCDHNCLHRGHCLQGGPICISQFGKGVKHWITSSLSEQLQLSERSLQSYHWPVHVRDDLFALPELAAVPSAGGRGTALPLGLLGAPVAGHPYRWRGLILFIGVAKEG